jgi:hypothetical protein
MKKTKPTTGTETAPEATTGIETPDDAGGPTPSQLFEQRLQEILEAWPQEALELLAGELTALGVPEGARRIEPRTADPALIRRLYPIGRDAVKGWVAGVPVASSAALPRREPSKYDKERAEGRRRLEESGRTPVAEALRWSINADREREGLPPIPEPKE